MPSIVLTPENVHELRCPASKRYELFYDKVMSGLAVQVMKSGVATYVSQYRTQTNSKKQDAIGSIDSIALEDAREQNTRLKDARRKLDTERTKVKVKHTLEAAFADYVKAKNIVPDNAKKYRQVLETYGGPLWLTELSAITQKDVLGQREKVKDGTFLEWHKKLGHVTEAKGSAGSANDLIEYGSMVCTYAGLSRDRNPFRGIDAYPVEASRMKVVIEPSAWPAIAKSLARREWRERMLFWTTLLMGARPGAAVRMLWARLDLTEGTYRLSNDKIECQGWKPAASPAWDYPVDYWLLEMLREHAAMWNKNDTFLFPSNQDKMDGQPLGVGALGRLFDSMKREGVLPDDATPYSLRYTRGTYSELMFGNSLIVQRMLNHATDWGKGQAIAGTRLGSTPGYVLTRGCRPYVDKYARTIRQLCGFEEMSEETRRVFIEGDLPTIYERHQYALDTGAHLFQLADKN
jgi:hypothetical protein